MSKKNLFNKKFNKSVLSITKRIESFFNFFKENFFNKKNFSRNLNAIDKRIFFTIATIVIAITGYFLSPSFFDKNKIKAELENQILDQYNLKVKFDATLKYGLFPKPKFQIDISIHSKFWFWKVPGCSAGFRRRLGRGPETSSHMVR